MPCRHPSQAPPWGTSQGTADTSLARAPGTELAGPAHPEAAQPALPSHLTIAGFRCSPFFFSLIFFFFLRNVKVAPNTRGSANMTEARQHWGGGREDYTTQPGRGQKLSESWRVGGHGAQGHTQSGMHTLHPPADASTLSRAGVQPTSAPCMETTAASWQWMGGGPQPIGSRHIPRVLQPYRFGSE